MGVFRNGRSSASASFYQACAWLMLKLCYRVRYQGFEKLPERGPFVMVANHVSYLDGVFLQCACRRHLRFVIDYEIFHQPGVHYFMSLHRAIPVLPRSATVKRAMDEVSEALRRGEAVMIFPEGRLTASGHLGRFKPGVERIVDRDPVPVYPVAIKGVWGSVFSRKYRRARAPWWPRAFRPEVTLICGDPLQPPEATVTELQRAVIRLLHEPSSFSSGGGMFRAAVSGVCRVLMRPRCMR